MLSLRAHSRLLATTLVLLALFAWSRAHGASAPYPVTKANDAISKGYLPAWWTVDDSVVRVTDTPYTVAIYCLTDRATGAKWILRTTKAQEITWYKTGQWTPAPKTPLLPSDYTACGFAPPGPRAIGGNAYWSIACQADCGAAGAPDMGLMDRKLVAGLAVAGEPCGASQGMGFYLLPRLQSPKGLTAVTKCQ
jgi:hypothetical protein